MRFFGLSRFLATLFTLTILTSFAAAQTASEEPTQQVGKPRPMDPDVVGAGGEFTHRVNIEIPEFRGLPLPVSLNYNSSNTSRSGVNNIVAFGWSLGGFSMIERKSLGGGVPTFDDGQDLYVLDGQELMACAGTGATNPWALKYPLRYLTDRANASCSAGGNLTARVEDFNRIVYDAVSNRFTVTRPDGVKLTYVSIGELAGDASAAGTPERNYATKARWLLTRIEDTQPTPNVVAYTYHFTSIDQAYAHRPATITYAGYTVAFDFRSYPAGAIPKFATGTSIIGQQLFQLRTIRVNGPNPIRAYRLNHQASALTGTQLLTAVQEYGSDFSMTYPDVTGGTALPANTFSYSSDTVSFFEANETNTPSLAGKEFHRLVSVLDENRDGADDLAFFSAYLTARQDHDNGPKYGNFHTFSAGLYRFNAQRVLLSFPGLPERCRSTPPYQSLAFDALDIGPVLGTDRTTSSFHCMATLFTYRSSSPPNSNPYTDATFEVRKFVGVAGASGSLTQNNFSGWLASNPGLLGNFDLDPGSEYHVNRHLYSIDAGVFSAGTYMGRRWRGGGAYIADFTGDGVDDFLSNDSLQRTLPEDGYLSDIWRSAGYYLEYGLSYQVHPLFPYGELKPYYDTTAGDFIGYGDMNGDGLNDVVFHEPNYNGADRITYFAATGTGFGQKVTLDLGLNLLSIPRIGSINVSQTISPRTEDHVSRIVDINADGLADIILHDGFPPRSDSYNSLPYSSGKSWVFLNTGSGFQHVAELGGTAGFFGLVAVGDFDGDNLTDLALHGTSGAFSYAYVNGVSVTIFAKRSGRIYFGNGGVPNRLTTVTSPSGGITTINHTSSSEFGVNQMPGVQHVVKSITTNDGRGGFSTTTYSYVGGRYDFINRQTLGYKTVTAHLPAIAGETVGPMVVTNYLNDHLAEYGLVKARTVTQGGVTLSREIFDYSVIKTGNGPWRADRIAERKATLFGSALVETTTTRSFDTYGQVLTEVSLGFTNPNIGPDFENIDNGDNLETSDDVNVLFAYKPNLASYIVDRPIYRREEKGAVHLYQTANLIYAALYSYDGAASYDTAPTVGNMTTVHELVLGLPASGTWRITRQMTYDAWGNVLTEKDAKGQTVATHTYDTTRRLFRLTTTNALGHLVTTVWNQACQSPASVTDPSARVTSYVYDAFCREQQVNLPGGQRKITRYVGFGSATGQYIEVDQLSGSVVAGRTFGLSRTYFDGLGQTYMTTSPGATSAIADSTIQINAYDARGNLAWTSLPLSWASFGATPSPAQRTSFTYDGLGRPLFTTHPDGTRRSTGYYLQTFSHFGALALPYPTVVSKDEHCYDLVSTNTICAEVQTVLDANGNTIRTYRPDHGLQDVDAGGAVWRTTQYRYDLKGRLIAVVDPGGATWAYTYDGFGNRLTSNDPGLGLWTLAYDLNNNLLSQTDAKGQVISFTYDALNRVLTKTVGTGAARVETVFTYDQVRATFFNKGHETTQKVWMPATSLVVQEVERNYHITGALWMERYTIDGRTYELASTIALTGAAVDQWLPISPGATTTGLAGAVTLDAAGRATSVAGLVTSITYNLNSQPLLVTYASGVTDTMDYDPYRNWTAKIIGRLPGQTLGFYGVALRRTATGRILRHETWGDTAGAYDFTYDYAGRLLSAINFRGVPTADQVFSYDKAGRLRSKGLPASPAVYSYADPTKPDHAPSTVTVPGTTTTVIIDGQTTISATPPIVTTFSYDANGNMLAMAVDNSSSAGKVMTYDAENRPLSVTHAGKKTCYVYGVDGKRLKKVENLAPNASCTALPATTPATVYFGAVEIRNWKLAGLEQILTYPHPSVKLTWTTIPAAGATPAYVAKEVSWLHRDHLGSVRAITRVKAGIVEIVEKATYKPFGEQSEVITATALPAAPETKGWIGERFDADAGLQYLNARYYDPVLGMFLQPDWWEVTKPGVGTNRYSYSFNDPINKIDPNGNGWFKELAKTVLSAFSDPKARAAGEASLKSGMEALRREAVASAWRQERELVRAGGGTRNWSDLEKQQLLKDGFVTDYDGHHINSVAGSPHLAGLANNIRFVKTVDHKRIHVDNGGYPMPTYGTIIDRNEMFKDITGNDLPSGTRERLTYEGVVNRAVSTADKILNSRTMMVIDTMDPSSWADRYMREYHGVDVFGQPVEWSDAFVSECIAAGRCT